MSIRLFLIGLIAALAASVASAATITWTGPTEVTDGSTDTQVITEGATLVAENYHGAGTTLNGVFFTGVTQATNTTIASGIALGVSVFYLGSNATMLPFLNPAFVDSNSGDPGYSMQIPGLTTGNLYTIQLFGGDERASFPNPIEVGDGVGGFSFKWGFPILQDEGSFVTGTFVADAATQSFSVRRDLGEPSGAGGGAILAGVNVRDLGSDPDEDGLSNLAEQTAGTDLLDPDTDDDGLLDGFEVTHSFNPLVAGEQNDDSDMDGLSNLTEQAAGTDPLDDDTDDDTLLDGQELATGNFGGQQVISTAAAGAWSVIGADLDGDGDTDVISASESDDKIAWYENSDGAGTFGGQQVISTLGDGPRSVFAADVDGDSDLDVLVASIFDDEIAWYENLYGKGTFGGQQVITNLADGAHSVFAADLDGDGDVDALSASQVDDEIAWYENTDGAGTFGGQQVISTLADYPLSVFAADVNGDGYIDVLSASENDDKIAWYRNSDGLGNFDGQQVISTLADHAFSVFAADLDGDDDLDVLSASSVDSKIAWYENTDGAGAFGAQQVITTLALSTRSVHAADVDGDGDNDALSSSVSDDKIAWYENTDGLGSFGGENVISTSADAALSVFAVDLDGDGDRDVLSASFSDNKIAWYEQLNLANPLLPDSDGDGLDDADEVNTHLTDPLLPDTDDDGLSDGQEVNVVGTDPLDPDTDGDNFCDGPIGVGPCVAGDNCPLLASADQTNGDAHPAGNVCQCGDVDHDGVVDETDLLRARENLVGKTLSGTFVATRCSVIGPGDECDTSDTFRLSRFLSGDTDALEMTCSAYSD